MFESTFFYVWMHIDHFDDNFESHFIKPSKNKITKIKLKFVYTLDTKNWNLSISSTQKIKICLYPRHILLKKTKLNPSHFLLADSKMKDAIYFTRCLCVIYSSTLLPIGRSANGTSWHCSRIHFSKKKGAEQRASPSSCSPAE